jgi:hypothetical protein
MAKRKLTRFDDVANVNKNNNDNVDVNNNVNNNEDINENNDINTNESDLVGSLRLLADTKSKKKGKESMKPTGIYFEENVLTVLKNLASNGGRGAQSKIVNDATKDAFIQAGLMDREGNIIKN